MITALAVVAGLTVFGFGVLVGIAIQSVHRGEPPA